MGNDDRSKSLVSIALVALLGASACTHSPIEQKTYNYSITSTPSDARVINEHGEHLGTTPLEVEQDYEQKSVSIMGWPFILGGVGAGALGASLLVIPEEDPGLGSVMGGTMLIGAGLSMAIVGTLASLGIMDTTQVRPVGSMAWRTMPGAEPTDEHIARALFGEVRLRAPGHRDQVISAQDNAKLAITMTPGTPGGEVREVAARAGTKVSSLDFVSASPQPTAFALVIGVENYRDIPAPNGARADAERFAKMLQESMGVPQKNIRLLTDQKATRSDILAQANWLKRTVPPGGRIYFYFSGHGSPDVETGQSYILPYEASPELLKDTGVQLSQVLGRLGKSDAKEVLAFVDSCFSGSGGRSVLPEGTRPLVPVKEVAAKPKVALFSAADASQISGNVPGENAGLFTSYVLEGLGKGRADADGNGQVTLAELGSYVQPRVERVAKQASRDQTPKLAMDDGLGQAENVIVTWGLPLD